MKATPQSKKIETATLEVVFYFSFELTSCLSNCTLSKNLVWRSCPSISRLLNQLCLNCTMYNYETPQLNIIHFAFLKSNQVLLHSFLATSIPLDQRCNEILDCILGDDLYILNDGSATRTSRNISLCGSNWSAKTSWRLTEPIGNSDQTYSNRIDSNKTDSN